MNVARQQLTWEWWTVKRAQYELFTSRFTLAEISRGDPSAAGRRLALMNDIPILPVSSEVEELTVFLSQSPFFPASAQDDLAHVAIASVYGIDFLLTWNCRHLANANISSLLTARIQEKGFRAPFMCTPDQLLE